LRHELRSLESTQADLIHKIRNVREGQPEKANIRSLQEDLTRANEQMAEISSALRAAQARWSAAPPEPHNGITVPGQLSVRMLRPPTRDNHQLYAAVVKVLSSRYPAKTLKGLHHQILVSRSDRPPYFRLGSTWVEYQNDAPSRDALAKLLQK
jgi:hypothetical protein